MSSRRGTALGVWGIVVCLSASTALASGPRAQDADGLEDLLKGDLAAVERVLSKAVEGGAATPEVRARLGMVQFLRSVERVVQSMHKHGMRQSPPFGGMMMPGMRSPIPPHPNPDVPSYDDIRAVIARFVEDLARAEATLAQVESSAVKVPVQFGMVRLDLNGDGKAEEDEALWRLYAMFNRGIEQSDAEQFVIVFDTADVHWLRGYCHLLMAFGEFALAYDQTELFQRAGHLVFTRVQTPHDFLVDGVPVFPWGGGDDVADVIAFVHCINFPLREPERVKRAHAHLAAMIEQSRRMWTRCLAETDDDREWIPNPKQTGVIPNVRVNDEMVAGWKDFLDEAGDLLEGKKLVPFWRTDDGRGVNLKRVFTEPRDFDLVLWFQGTAASPYLERGELTKEETWDRFERIFQGDFIGFAIWFN